MSLNKNGKNSTGTVKKLKNHHVDLDVAYADMEKNPDWSVLSVVPMSDVAPGHFFSATWNFFGQLRQGDVCVDKKYYYCIICFEDTKLKPFSVQTSSTTMSKHLKRHHAIDLAPGKIFKRKEVIQVRDRPKRKKKSKVISTCSDKNEVHINGKFENKNNINIITKKEIDYSEFVECDNDYLDQEDDEKYLKVVTVQVEKEQIGNELASSDILSIRKTSCQSQSSNCISSYSTNRSASLDDTSRDTDVDRLFLLSLQDEFKRIPVNKRLQVKSEIINTIIKHQVDQ